MLLQYGLRCASRHYCSGSGTAQAVVSKYRSIQFSSVGSSVQSVLGCVGYILQFPYVVCTAEDRPGAETHVCSSMQKQLGGSGTIKGGSKGEAEWNVGGWFGRIGLLPISPFDFSPECACEGLLGFQFADGCIFDGRVWSWSDFRFISVIAIGRCSEFPRLSRWSAASWASQSITMLVSSSLIVLSIPALWRRSIRACMRSCR